ncbi:MAG: S8 family serine peptidase [Winogradskyella sp.]|nr:S8 family serine peptidase [Winogradskyella sp.]
MKNLLILLLLMAIPPLVAQEDAWVYLTDKPNVTASINNPISILTQKAIDRKNRHGIFIDDRDVPVYEDYISQLKAQPGITVLAKSKWFNAIYVRGTQSNINALNSLSFVDYIQFADSNLNARNRSIAIDHKFQIENQQTTFVYGNAQNQVEMIAAEQLHLDDYTGEGITIAVMDSGFPGVNTIAAFSRLRTNGDLLDGYDFVDRTANIYAYAGSSHGTRVLSDMAGYIENQFVGTAPDASYYLFRTEDAASENPVEESYWVEAAERADSLGVDIINTSLGYTTYDNPNYSYSPSDMDGNTAFITQGATIASEKGLLVVTSAGNSGANSWQIVGAPADSPLVLSVGAVNASGEYAFFSSQGSSAQPTQKPDVVAQGFSAYVVDENNAIVQNNGTSFSSPILCGGVACLMQALPNTTPPNDIIEFVRQSASQYTTPDDFLGHGIPNLDLARNLGLSINDYNLRGVSVYPNPFQEKLVINASDLDAIIQLSIYNQLGQLIYTKKGRIEAIDVSELNSGIYVVSVISGDQSANFKLIKN